MMTIEDELRSGMMDSVRAQIEAARLAQAEAEAQVQYLASTLMQQQTESYMEKTRLEELLNIERLAKAGLEARILALEGRQNIVIPEQKEPDLSGIIAALSEISGKLDKCMEVPEVEPLPLEFDVLRGDDGRIYKLKVKE